MVKSSKIFFLFAFLFIAFFFLSPRPVQAACYLSGQPGFATCMAGATSQPCFSGGSAYACCDSLLETCPAVPSPTSPPIPPTVVPTSPPGATPVPTFAPPPTPTTPPFSTTCSDPVAGCFVCGDYSSTNICTYVLPASGTPECNPGYHTAPNQCHAYDNTSSTQCLTVQIPCTTTVGQFYCSVSSGCTACSGTSCPTGQTIYANQAQCLTACNAGAIQCLSVGGGGGHCDFANNCTSNGGTSYGSGYGCAAGLICCVPPSISAIRGNNAAFCNSGYTLLNSAIGCIPINNISSLINSLIRWALGIAGGIAFVLIIVAGFQYATSAGDPKRAKAAQELLTSAIGGLILIAISVVILNFIGVTILNLGSLGFHG